MYKITSIMNEWKFTRLSTREEAPSLSYKTVQLPHVWNKDMPQEEGCVLYEKNVCVSHHTDAEYLLCFDGVGGIAEVYLNGKLLGTHRGSYSCFCFCITNELKDRNNLLQVFADNRRDGSINPVTGDFSYFGGIYRNVTLIETGKAYFDRTYYGTSGVLLRTEADGKIHLQAHVAGGEEAKIHYQILDAQKNIVAETIAPGSEEETELMVQEPHLWNGREDPYCYTCRAELKINGMISDAVSLEFGFRSISLNSETGFFLNGEHLRLHGVAKHQDYEGYACGTGKEQIEKDFELIDEVGANAIRFSHYQHPQYAYTLADHMGFVAWAEIPMLAMEDGNTKLIENAKEQLKELILQNLHHPSICFWGLQNEIGMRGESLETYASMKQLEALAKQLDPTRLTACAEVFSVPDNSELNFIHDAVGYNLYYGWYTGEFADYITFAKKFHADNPDVPLAITEYGADCNLQYHSSKPERQDYSEEYQALYHESVYGVSRKDSVSLGHVCLEYV
jgi:beta-galactosidase